VGVEYGCKTMAINGKVIKLQIWDTAGQEEFKAITRSYYRSSAAALVVFDITRRESFRNCVRWVEDVKSNSNKDVILVLVGNKADLAQERMVARNDALKLARDYEMLYIETSAKSQENVERAFVWPATTILDKV
jgi:Ras-related protein Rab-2A